MFDGYLSVGTRSREYLRHFGVPEPLIFDSPHAVDNARFTFEAGDGNARIGMRRTLGAAPDDFVVLFAGKFIDVKRPGDVCAAAARLGPKVVVAMAGTGALLNATRARVEQLGVRVAWLGFLNQAEMPRLLAAVDCVAVPSRSESWALIVNEALACGTPCVVSDHIGCAPDLVHDDRSGSVHRVGDVGDLARALARVREAARNGLVTRESCRDAVAENSFERAAEGLGRAIDRVVQRRATAASSRGGEPRVIATLGNMVSVFGLERMTFEVLRTLRERDAAVHCVVNRWQSSRVVDLADDIGATWSTGYYWYELRRRADMRAHLLAGWDVVRTSIDLLKDARRFRATHVLAPEFNAVLRSAPALWLLRRAGVRVILRLGNAPEPGRFYELLWRHVIDRCVDQYVPNSQFIQQELLAHGVAPAKSRVVYNTVPHRPDEWQRQQPRAGHVLYVGQIIPQKGVDLLVEAIALLRRRGMDATLDVVGDIEGWEHPSFAGYRAGVRIRAQQPDLEGAVRFLGVRDDVPVLMATASVHCLPSRPEQKEGFTVVTLEAKRAGLPSVVTRSGALPEMVRHTVDGWICSEVTAESIAEGLAYFLADTDRARRAGDEARASERAYNRARFVLEWADVFATCGDAIPSSVHIQPS
jgi:glycosyltransferase involved in cell wall biosynthesis